MKPRAWILLGIAAILIALPFFLDVRSLLESLVARLQAFGVAGLLGLAAFYVVACVLMLPGSLLTLGMGALAGVLWPDRFFFALLCGTAAVSAGSVSGATVAFLLGRNLLRDSIAAKMAHNPRFAALDRAIGKRGLQMTFLVRLSPAFPFSLLNYALGLTSVSLRDYVLASWIGMLPGTVMYVYIGMLFGLSATPGAGGLGQKVLLACGLVATAALVVYVTRVARRALAEVLDEAPAVSEAS